MNKPPKLLVIIISAFAAVNFIGIFIMATLADLEISINITVLVEHFAFIKAFAKQMSYFGDIGLFLVVLIFGSLFINWSVHRFSKKENWFTLKIIFQILLFLFFLTALTYNLWLFNDVDPDDYVYYFLAIGLNILFALFIQILVMVKIKDESGSDELIVPIINGVIYLVALWVIITVLKYSFGRPRFRDLKPDYSDYKPWYGNILSSENRGTSFPSGHVGIVCSYLGLVWLLKPLKMDKKLIKIMLSILFSIIVVSMCFARIAVKAHFLTDVMASTVIPIPTIWLINKMSPKLGELVTKKKQEEIEDEVYRDRPWR
ncbi:phosphatase PAP2 family protein [Spiroplasma alleghenense]|uniref:Phosphatidic acid phosphatase type 2/haloperoxidase domain-containing protein n=1 Tax=Spiroplasma alleghenense TaxID=216931 RepID=A0A345Z2M2_9MOLU|nr:phosphatase PAP2 family protein [Spiroplasma alleghenense]AXK50851.1 hypothetical protein SALLE_v1c01750 [Spiroplasma alleghenense]